MRHRVSWLILVVTAALVISWLTSPTTSRAQDSGLAVTPCKITAQPTTVGDPRIRFKATVTFGPNYATKMPKTAPATTADFFALPSRAHVHSVRVTRSFTVEFHVPDGTREIGVRLTTGRNVDPTIPVTKDMLGRYPIDAKSPTTRMWTIHYASKAGPKPTPTPAPTY